MIESLSAMVLTYNEAPNLQRTLAALSWIPEVLVVDSFSNDETAALISKFPNTRIVQRNFDSFASQCNFGLSHIRSDWVLSLDADYVATPEASFEIQNLPADPPCQGYQAAFIYCVHGHPLRSTLYPPRTILYRRSQARYYDDGHGHRVAIEGKILHLSEKILHDDRKPLSRWLTSQGKYAAMECLKLGSTPWCLLGWPDRLRKTMLLAPPATLIYCLLVRGLILDGWHGWFYTLQRVLAEIILALHLLNQHLSRKLPRT